MAGQIKVFLGVARCRPAVRMGSRHSAQLDWINWSKGQLYNKWPLARSLAQLIGAAPHVSMNYILAMALFAAVALTASQFHLSFSPDPNPQQVHLTHSLKAKCFQRSQRGLAQVAVGKQHGAANVLDKERERGREGERGGTCLARVRTWVDTCCPAY